MATPVCPRTLAPVWRFGNEATNEDLARSRYPEAAPCIGSRCALWVPERNVSEGDDGVRFSRPTNHGLCADNPHATPWPDPNPETPK